MCHFTNHATYVPTMLTTNRMLVGWYQAGLPFEGNEEYKPDVGRTPMAAFEPTLKQMASARGYEMRPDDKQ